MAENAPEMPAEQSPGTEMVNGWYESDTMGYGELVHMLT